MPPNSGFPFDLPGFGEGSGGGFDWGGGIGGGVGGALGGPIGAAIGSWVGSKLGKVFRLGGESPEEFVDRMLREGRVPEFLSGILTRDRLLAAERQSRGAGSAVDLAKKWTDQAILALQSNDAARVQSEVDAFAAAVPVSQAKAQSESNAANYHLLLADVLAAMGRMTSEAWNNIQNDAGNREHGVPGSGGAGEGSHPIEGGFPKWAIFLVIGLAVTMLLGGAGNE